MKGFLGGKLYPHILLELCIFLPYNTLWLLGTCICLPCSKRRITGDWGAAAVHPHDPRWPWPGFVPAPPPKQCPCRKQCPLVQGQSLQTFFCLVFGFLPPLQRCLSPGQGAVASGHPRFPED